MKRALAWVAAHVLYQFGDLVSKAFVTVPEGERWEWLGSWLYWCYNRSMITSCNLSDAYDLGLWQAVKSDE